MAQALIMPFRKACRALRADRLMATAVVFLVILLLVGSLGPWLPIGDPTAIGAGPRLAPPSADFPLGADSDRTGHLFRFEGGHPFRSDAGRRSDLMPAT